MKTNVTLNEMYNASKAYDIAQAARDRQKYEYRNSVLTENDFVAATAEECFRSGCNECYIFNVKESHWNIVAEYLRNVKGYKVSNMPAHCKTKKSRADYQRMLDDDKKRSKERGHEWNKPMYIMCRKRTLWQKIFG